MHGAPEGIRRLFFRLTAALSGRECRYSPSTPGGRGIFRFVALIFHYNRNISSINAKMIKFRRNQMLYFCFWEGEVLLSGPNPSLRLRMNEPTLTITKTL